MNTLAPALSRRLQLGAVSVDPPVVLAPMAGITNAAYRRLCREQGAGLYVCEMITSRGLVERDPKTLSMLVFDEGEQVRSVQLYGVDPVIVGEAVRILCGEFAVGHVDLNFGCPVPKVTRKGGGAALPWKTDLLAAITGSAVRAAAPYGVPVTIKTRLGVDLDHLTYLDAGRIAQDTGVAAIALHARTAAQHYSGVAAWEHIAALVDEVDIPVLGNGDIWEAADAVAMMNRTGCAGVVVGRGCLGRPWLFRDLAAVIAGRPAPGLPDLGQVAAMVRRHGELLVEYAESGRAIRTAEDAAAGRAGSRDEDGGPELHACRELRKHMSWYFKGFHVGSQIRAALGLVSSLATLDDLLGRLNPAEPFPERELGAPRGRQGSPRRVALPDGWLSSRTGVVEADAELGISGG